MNEQIMQAVNGLRAQTDAKMAELGHVGEDVLIPTRSGDRHALAYRPENATGCDPLFVNVHGGGFIYGSPEIDDDFCQAVCDELGVVVLNVSYRLAPESRWPSDKEDVYDAVKYLHDNPGAFGIDPDRIAIGGHSAGGNISTVVAMMAKETGDFSLRCVIMDYPPCDQDTDAFAKPTPEGCIDPQFAAVFDACYRDVEDARNPRLSPVFATSEDLAGMPPHVIVTAEGDSLCEEAEEYAKHLMAAGVEVTGRRFMGVAHGFTIERYGVVNPGTPEQVAASVKAANDLMVDGLRRHLL